MKAPSLLTLPVARASVPSNMSNDAADEDDDAADDPVLEADEDRADAR